MLRIFNGLEPFFRDNYRRINIREYSRIRRISPPSASKLLESMRKAGLLVKEKEKGYIYYAANRESREFVELSRVYWLVQLKKVGLIAYLEKELVTPLIILFGSFSKAEIRRDSDIDLAIFTSSKKALVLEGFETKLGRKIQALLFRTKEDVRNKELLKNILNGFVLSGSW